MNTILGTGIILTLYGLAGLFGIRQIPTKFQDTSWTRRYIHYQGISWLLLEIPWIVLGLEQRIKGLECRHVIPYFCLQSPGICLYGDSGPKIYRQAETGIMISFSAWHL